MKMTEKKDKKDSKEMKKVVETNIEVKKTLIENKETNEKML